MITKTERTNSPDGRTHTHYLTDEWATFTGWLPEVSRHLVDHFVLKSVEVQVDDPTALETATFTYQRQET